MPETAAAQIAGFLGKYLPAVQKQARAARRKLRALMPTAVEMIYDNYNGLVFGFTPGQRASEAIASLLILPDHVTLCFLQGAALDDPDGLLQGSGSQVRHIKLAGASDLDRAPIRALLKQAIARAKVPLPKTGRATTIVKSVSAKQRPRRPRPRR